MTRLDQTELARLMKLARQDRKRKTPSDRIEAAEGLAGLVRSAHVSTARVKGTPIITFLLRVDGVRKASPSSMTPRSRFQKARNWRTRARVRPPFERFFSSLRICATRVSTYDIHLCILFRIGNAMI